MTGNSPAVASIRNFQRTDKFDIRFGRFELVQVLTSSLCGIDERLLEQPSDSDLLYRSGIVGAMGVDPWVDTGKGDISLLLFGVDIFKTLCGLLLLRKITV